jgi:hypothetical protein
MQSKRPKEETMARKVRLPNPAMVVAVIALFVALTSTAVAGTVVARAKLANNAGGLTWQHRGAPLRSGPRRLASIDTRRSCGSFR